MSPILASGIFCRHDRPFHHSCESVGHVLTAGDGRVVSVRYKCGHLSSSVHRLGAVSDRTALAHQYGFETRDGARKHTMPAANKNSSLLNPSEEWTAKKEQRGTKEPRPSHSTATSTLFSNLPSLTLVPSLHMGSPTCTIPLTGTRLSLPSQRNSLSLPSLTELSRLWLHLHVLLPKPVVTFCHKTRCQNQHWRLDQRQKEKERCKPTWPARPEGPCYKTMRAACSRLYSSLHMYRGPSGLCGATRS